MNKPLVSIFLPYYNDERFIRDTIKSILNNTYNNFELILFNHAATDKSRKIAHSFRDQRIIHIDSKENLGAGSGLNSYNVLRSMRGKYIKFICADDMILPKYLEKLVLYMEASSGTDIIFSDMFIGKDKDITSETIYNNKFPYNTFDVSNEKSILKLLFMRHSPIIFSSALIRKSALEPNYLDKSYIQLFDVNLWASMIINGSQTHFFNEPLGVYRYNETQMTKVLDDTNGKLKATFFEVLAAQNVYYKIRDFNLLKTICNNSPFISLVNENETWSFEFIIAHYMLQSLLPQNTENFASYFFPIQLCGYLKLHEIFENDELRNKVKKKFDFGIKELRQVYTYTPPPTQSHPYKKRKYDEICKDLTFKEIVFILARKIYLCLRPSNIHTSHMNMIKKINSKNCKDLTFKEIIFLLNRKIYLLFIPKDKINN